MKFLKSLVDIMVMLVMTVYFVFFFLLFYWLVYVWIYFFAADRAAGFQAANHYYLRGLFFLFRLLIPGLKIKIPELDRIRNLKSSMIVVNHVSFLDPLLMVSLFRRTTTLGKAKYFKTPVFGWILRNSGYSAASFSGEDELWADRIVKEMKKSLDRGGNIFIFPEGTRGRTGRLKPFKKGAFFFAKALGAPVEMFYLTNTDVLYSPGRFFLNTCVDNTIELAYLGKIPAVKPDAPQTPGDIRNRVSDVFRKHLSETNPDPPPASSG